MKEIQEKARGLMRRIGLPCRPYLCQPPPYEVDAYIELLTDSMVELAVECQPDQESKDAHCPNKPVEIHVVALALAKIIMDCAILASAYGIELDGLPEWVADRDGKVNRSAEQEVARLILDKELEKRRRN